MKKRICLSSLHPEALFVQMAKVGLLPNHCEQTNQTNKERPFNKAAPHTDESPLHRYKGVMERRGDGSKRLNLGRSIDHSWNGLQHFWVGIGVVSVCIGFVLPQTDRNL
jgi:hypothetical protein